MICCGGGGGGGGRREGGLLLRLMTPNKSARVGGSRLAIWAAAALTALPSQFPTRRDPPPPHTTTNPPSPPSLRRELRCLPRAVPPQLCSGSVMGRRWIRGQTEARSGWILRLHTGGLITGATVGPVLPLFCPALDQSRRGASAQCKQGGTAVTHLMRAPLIESGRAAEMAVCGRQRSFAFILQNGLLKWCFSVIMQSSISGAKPMHLMTHSGRSLTPALPGPRALE